MDIFIIRRTFGTRPFTASEAAWALGLRRPSGTLSRLKSAGLLEKAGRGKYRVAPTELADAVAATAREEKIREVLAGPVPVALDGRDAVALWTGGRYHVGFAPGRHVVYLACAQGDREALAEELSTLGVPWVEGEDSARGRGLLVRVRFLKRLDREKRSGVQVVSRREVLRLIGSDPAAYEGAKEWVER